MSFLSPALKVINLSTKLFTYIELFKMKQTFLLVFTGILGYFISSKLNINPQTLLIYITAITLAVSGTTGLNMYYDKDIDTLMFRTKNRPLPSKKISPKEAYIVSLLFTTIGIGLGFYINLWCGIAITLGFIFDILVYTIALKRKTPLNIVFGSIAGAMPTLSGYVAHKGYINIQAILLSSIVMIWSTIHIWLISTYYINDYRKARIPMLPVVVGERKTIYTSLLSLILINIILITLYLINFTKLLSTTFSFLFTIRISTLLKKYLSTKDKNYVRKAYKILSPYIGTILILIFLERTFLP